MSPRSRSTLSRAMSWIRPERSTRSRKLSLPISRRAMTRPATRCSCSRVSPGSAFSDSARTAAISSRSANRFGSMAAESKWPCGLSGFDLEDLELHRAARSGDLDGLALLLADDGLADGRLVRELVLRRVRLGRADDAVLERLLRADVSQAHLGTDRDNILSD